MKKCDFHHTIHITLKLCKKDFSVCPITLALSLLQKVALMDDDESRQLNVLDYLLIYDFLQTIP